MAVFGQSQSRPGLTTAYDAYSPVIETSQQLHQPQHLQPHTAHSPHHQQQHQPRNQTSQQHAQQPPWYDVRDGGDTSPDDTTSRRDSRVIGPSLTGARMITECRIIIVAGLEVVILIAMAILVYLLRIVEIFPVHQLSFSCYDPNISSKTDASNYTFSLLTDVSNGSRETTILVCFCFPPLFISISEIIMWTMTRQNEHVGTQYCRLSLPFRRITRFTGTYVFGLLAAMIMADVIKLMTGCLRPDFLDVCQPNVSMCEAHKVDTLHQATDICLQTNAGALRQARKSFPSMQATITVYAAFFLAIYIHNVVCCGLKFSMLRPLLSLLSIFFSVMCCLANHAVRRNHVTDILAGFGLGLVLAGYLAGSVLNCFVEKLSPNRLYSRLERALGLMHCSIDDLDSSVHGDLKSRSSSSSAAGPEWRCTDSTSARSWSHYAVHHLTPLHLASAVTSSTNGTTQKGLE